MGVRRMVLINGNRTCLLFLYYIIKNLYRDGQDAAVDSDGRLGRLKTIKFVIPEAYQGGLLNSICR